MLTDVVFDSELFIPKIRYHGSEPDWAQVKIPQRNFMMKVVLTILTPLELGGESSTRIHRSCTGS
jgi:hypothetical protein